MKRKELQQLRDTWPVFNSDLLPEDERPQFMLRKKCVDLYIDGVKLKLIEEETGIPASEIIRYVKKCCHSDKEGRMIGYTALIRYKHTRARQTKLIELFLQYPTLKDFVIGNYTGNKDYTLEHNMNIRTLHTRFIEESRRLGIQDYEYPFTTKDNGYQAINFFIKKYIADKDKIEISRESTNAIQKYYSTGIGKSNYIIPIYPYNIVQIDGHKIDLLYTIEMENEKGEIIRDTATRVWLIAVIDVASRAILGYSLSPYENYNQYDVLKAIKNSIKPHERINFTHRLEYPENGGFPSEYIPSTEWAIFDTIMLDNAKAHLAKTVLSKITYKLKCSVNFGSVATPESRGIVERFFGTLERGGFHRLPGTTGSNIMDNKRKAPEKESIKYQISYEDIEELMEYFIASYNNSAHSSLDNQTPLQVLKRKIEQAGMKPSIVPVNERSDIEKLTYIIEERTLRGGYSNGKRPHFSYKGITYHAVDIRLSMDMVGQKVNIEVNPDDISKVSMFTKQGSYICEMIASGEYGRYPHSLKTREWAQKQANKNKEVNTVFSPHLTNLEKEFKANAKKSSRSRTKANIVRKEISKNGNSIEKEVETRITPPVNSSMPESKKEIKISHNNRGYTEEQRKLIDSMSIEEAFEKGLFG